MKSVRKIRRGEGVRKYTRRGCTEIYAVRELLEAWGAKVFEASQPSDPFGVRQVIFWGVVTPRALAMAHETDEFIVFNFMITRTLNFDLETSGLIPAAILIIM